MQALIKELLYSAGLAELTGDAQVARLFSVSGGNGTFGNQMSPLLPGSSLSSHLIVVTE